MGKKKTSDTNVKALMELLDDHDGMVRLKARKSLVTLGKRAVPALSKALKDSKSHQLRWEAAKALGVIADDRTIPLFVAVLGDSDADVAWVAAEALNDYQKAAWPALLRMLMADDKNAVVRRQRAHHVFRGQKVKGYDDLLASLLKALETGADREGAILASNEILKRMKTAP